MSGASGMTLPNFGTPWLRGLSGLGCTGNPTEAWTSGMPTSGRRSRNPRAGVGLNVLHNPDERGFCLQPVPMFLLQHPDWVCHLCSSPSAARCRNNEVP